MGGGGPLGECRQERRGVDQPVRVLHLATESKFLDAIMRHAEAAFPGANRFRIRPSGSPLGKRVAQAFRGEGGYFPSRDQRSEDFAWCDVVLVHWLGQAVTRDLESLPLEKALVWCCWGGDHYRIAPGSTPLLLDETARLRRLKHRLKTASARHNAPAWFLRAAPRIDRFCSLMQAPPFTEIAPILSDRRLPEFPYYSESGTFRQGPDQMKGSDILLGNSATLENNHLDALTLLSRLSGNSRRIILPLNYGDRKVADAVSERARSLFGDRAVILRKWMPIADYNAAISGCGTTIMNHVRAQAMGNVANALYKGSNVFLRRESPLYRHFLDLDATVFAFDETIEKAEFDAPLDSKTIASNREAIHSAYSAVAVTGRIRLIINEAVIAAANRLTATQ